MERKKQEKFVTYRQKHAFDSFGLYDAGSCCAAVFWPVSAFLEQRQCAGLYPFPLYKDRTQAAILFPLYCRDFYGIVYGCPDYIYFWIISLPGSYPFSDHIPIWMTAVLDHIHSWMISVSGLYTKTQTI